MEELLRAMGLPQYVQTFRREQVTGSLFLQCSEGMLLRDLCVESELHRMRLLALISGLQSARDTLAHTEPHQ